MDGTILDTLEDLTDSINHALRINGYPIHTIDEVRSYVGNGIRKLVERAVPKDISETDMEVVFNEFMNFYPKNCSNKTKPYEGIVELMKLIKKEGIHIAVNSNKNDAEVKTLAAKYFGDLIEYCVGSIENVPKKPQADGVKSIMKYFGAKETETIYIGDSEVDILTAINADIDAIIVDWGFRERELLEEYSKSSLEKMNCIRDIHIVSTCQDILDICD